MCDTILASNPFKVFTPEGMSARDAVDLFVEVSEFNKIQDPGNTILNGPRGSGKSMLFRYLMPDCQMIKRDLRLDDLPFFAVLVPIKNTNPNITELRRLEFQSTRAILNEHLLTCFASSKLLSSLIEAAPEGEDCDWSNSAAVLYRRLVGLFATSGWSFEPVPQLGSARETLAECMRLCDFAYSAVTLYAKRLSFSKALPTYEGALCDFVTFLCPVIAEMQSLPGFPSAPVYLLIDDADFLSLDQTKVLNAWIATRTSSVVSLKLSTQFDYKTFTTFAGHQVRSPHDFQEINMVDVYTTKHSTYVRNVRHIVAKRLKKARLLVEDPRTFFPDDEEQELAIRKIAEEIRGNWEIDGRGFRVEDDVARYARPEFIRRLGGSAKSTSTYSYAGFEQLAHISSGQVRYFLEPAAEMYDEAKVEANGRSVGSIRTKTQNAVVRREAEKLMFSDFDKLKSDAAHLAAHGVGTYQESIQRLRNLIRFLGHVFFRKLISNDSERRVFSVAVSGNPDRDVSAVFEIGVRHGFFHRSSIGNKEGTGRTQLYVLTRRLAPHFNLDPSSFAGYQFITNGVLRQAMADPDRVLRSIRRKDLDSLANDKQMKLFRDEDLDS